MAFLPCTFLVLTKIGHGNGALYDLSRDPFEKTDLTGNMAFVDTLAELEARMIHFQDMEEEADIEEYIVAGLWKRAGGITPWLDAAQPEKPERPQAGHRDNAPNLVFILADDIGMCAYTHTTDPYAMHYAT